MLDFQVLRQRIVLRAFHTYQRVGLIFFSFDFWWVEFGSYFNLRHAKWPHKWSNFFTEFLLVKDPSSSVFLGSLQWQEALSGDGQWLLPFFHLRKDGHSQLSMKLKVDIDEITAKPPEVWPTLFAVRCFYFRHHWKCWWWAECKKGGKMISHKYQYGLMFPDKGVEIT